MALLHNRSVRLAARPATAVLATLSLTTSFCAIVGPLTSASSAAATPSKARPAVRAQAPFTREEMSFTSPEQVTYSLVTESNGQTPSAGSSVSVIFAGQGVAWLLATSSGGDLSYQGTWTYHADRLSLAFSTDGFDRKGTFNAALGSNEITVPFQVFTSKPGTSTWDESVVDPTLSAFSIAVADDSASGSGEPMSALVEAAADYVGSVTRAPVDGGTGGAAISVTALRTLHDASAGPPTLHLARFASVARLVPQRHAAQLVVGRLLPEVQNDFGGVMHVDINSDGFDVVYKSRTVNVLMATEAASDGPVENLTAGPFASDPRTNNVEQSPHNGVDDPQDKTAVLYEPFLYGDQQSWSWRGSKIFATVSGSADVNYYKGETSALHADGYKVKLLDGDSASIVDLIQAVSGGATPGLLVIRTHGTSKGALVTSDYLGHTADEALANQDSLNDELEKDYGMPASATAIGALDIEETLPGAKDEYGGYYLEITPDFWTWLRADRGANFSHSLVFVGACLTDATPYLRNAILARAYFAWKVSAVNETDAAIADYLITMLVKPTVTPEEVYYNLLRIDATGHYAFKDDLILNNQLVSQANTNAKDLSVPYTPEALQYVFDAYGNDNGEMTPYIANGWLGEGIDEGQIWTMIWAARWGKDIKQGVGNLEGCEDGVWEKGTVGGINSTCQDWTDGNVPTKEEVAYAVYLVTGDDIGLEGTPTLIPRFTLNDAGSG